MTARPSPPVCPSTARRERGWGRGCRHTMRELILHCPGDITDALSDALLTAGCLSVSVEDLDSGSDAEAPLFGEPGLTPDALAWARNRVTALLADGSDPAHIVAAVEWVGDWTTQNVPDADWVRVTQAQFGPIPVVGARRSLLIVPSWHAADTAVPEEALAIQLDPGLAFGTGSHPTTHLCLQWLLDELPAQATVLDYGCGSGLLAIAAQKLAAGTTHAVDIDPQAVTATRENARVNRVNVTAMLPDELGAGCFDVVIANILSNPLKVLAPMLAARVAAGGHLVLSGVLARQAEEVAAAYAPWLHMSVWREADGWVCLAGQRA